MMSFLVKEGRLLGEELTHGRTERVGLKFAQI